MPPHALIALRLNIMGTVIYPSVTLQPGQQVTLTAATMLDGAPASLAGTPAWTTNVPSFISLTPNVGGYTCVVTAANPLPVASGGVAVVTVALLAPLAMIYGYCTVNCVPVPVAPIPNELNISVGPVS